MALLSMMTRMIQLRLYALAVMIWLYLRIPTLPSVAGHMPHMYITDQKWTVGLLKILDDMNAQCT
jgi:hypothetical protein